MMRLFVKQVLFFQRQQVAVLNVMFDHSRDELAYTFRISGANNAEALNKLASRTIIFGTFQRGSILCLKEDGTYPIALKTGDCKFSFYNDWGLTLDQFDFNKEQARLDDRDRYGQKPKRKLIMD